MFNKRMLVIGTLMVVIVVLAVGLPLGAQVTWQEECKVPDLKDLFSSTRDVQADGDMVTFVNAWHEALFSLEIQFANCLVSAAAADVDLQGAELFSVILSRQNLSGANLQDANLGGANLQEAVLNDINLQGAWLHYTNLRGADLRGANLSDAQFNEESILPDGEYWTPDTDLSRFTNPEHPDFWNPCVDREYPPWYC